MANQEQIERIEQGVEAWNIWRMANWHIEVDLSNANLTKNNLSNTDLTHLDGSPMDWGTANLFGINLSGANLIGTNFSDANLTGANLSGTNLTGANFSGTNLEGARMINANLIRANLYDAKLIYVDFSYSDLTNANLASAHLFAANFNTTILNNANFDNTYLVGSIFANLDLRTVQGLHKIKDPQEGPWTIGIDTIMLSQGKIPSTFLKSAGISNSLIEYAASLIGNAIDFYSCFISYSSKDQGFAKRLYADLQNKGVRCWFAPKDLKIGDKIRPRIDESIRLYDKLLLVLSEHSVASQWVEQEVETALEKERKTQRAVLFPVRLDNIVMDIEGGWAALIRNTRNIGDFACWKDYDAYQQSLERLLRDLKASKNSPVDPLYF